MPLLEATILEAPRDWPEGFGGGLGREHGKDTELSLTVFSGGTRDVTYSLKADRDPLLPS